MDRARSRALLITALLCAELAALAAGYQILVSFECQASGAEQGCRFLRTLVARTIAVFAAVSALVWARPASLRLLVRPRPRPALVWPVVHFVGVGLMFAPLLFAADREPADFFALAIGPWLVGAAAAAAGALFWLAPLAAWWAWLRAERGVALVILAIAFVIPDLAELAQPAWETSGLTRLTFFAVEATLRLFSSATLSDPASYVIGVDDFFVHIARQCSGVEGFALVGGFILLYAYLFRAQTRFPQFWILVLPVGMALSWGLNVLRITALILIGARVSPELAVNGFHSYAGWMFFTALAMSLLFGIQAIPWLQARGPRRAPPPPPLIEDWDAARILPFVAFMAASVVASALVPVSDLAYPLKAFAMAATLALFHRAYSRLELDLDPVALATGLVVGAVWIARAPAPGAEDAALATAIASLGGLAFFLWVAIRLIGTVLLVPVVEELFFRGYVLVRLDRGGIGWRLLALAVSTGCFAALHGRWLEAALAGLAFGLLALRRGRLADAIQAHVAANLLVALWAVSRNDWGAI